MDWIHPIVRLIEGISFADDHVRGIDILISQSSLARFVPQESGTAMKLELFVKLPVESR